MTVHSPIETRSSGLPRWALLLTLLVFLVGAVYLAGNLVGDNPALAIPGASGPAAPSGAISGEALLNRASPQCSTCHGADYAGQASFPSLHGLEEGPVSENLQDLAAEYPDTWAQLWIAGGPETEGIDRLGMPVFGDQFSPEELDAMVDYLSSLP